jgi:hypothetical protein
MAGTAAAVAMVVLELKSRPDALLIAQGGLPGDGGGGLDTMLWGRQVDLSSIISRDMGCLTAMAATTASAKDASAPGTDNDGAGALSSSLGGGGAKVVHVLYREVVGISGGGGNIGMALSGFAVLKRHSPFIILQK